MNGALLDLLTSILTPGPLRLLVCHSNDAALTGALHGLYRAAWWRVAGPEKAAVWPEGGPYDEVILPLPRGKESLRLCLHAVSSVIKSEGVVWLVGLNDLGIKSADKALGEFFNTVEAAATGGHGRIWRASVRKDTAVKSLASLSQSAALPLPGGSVQLFSYPGLFAGGALDEGTNLLLTALADVAINPRAAVLDYACGIGVIAYAVAQRVADANITVADNDPLALLAAAANMPSAKPQLTALPNDLVGQYDLIVSNPPIHQGDTQSFQVIDMLLGQLQRLLLPVGYAVLVAQVTVPVARMAAIHKLKCEEIAASRSFRVWKIAR